VPQVTHDYEITVIKIENYVHSRWTWQAAVHTISRLHHYCDWYIEHF